jgi:hypothetical protein
LVQEYQLLISSRLRGTVLHRVVLRDQRLIPTSETLAIVAAGIEGKMADKIEMRTENLDGPQNALVILHLWTALRQAVVEMHALNGSQAVFDFQQKLILGAKNGEVTGLPLEQEKAVVDTVVRLFEGLVSFDG